MKNAIYLAGTLFFYLLCGEREQVLGLISTCAKCSFENNNKKYYGP